MRLYQSVVFTICCCLSCMVLHAADTDSRLQGIWFGDGQHPMSRHVLVVEGEEFTVVSPQGVFVSKFKTNDSPVLAEIDIERFDGGRQLGVFELSDTELRLKLNGPNQARPTVRDVRFPSGKPHWHAVFLRRPSHDGLEVLTKHIEVLTKHSSKLPAAQE